MLSNEEKQPAFPPHPFPSELQSLRFEIFRDTDDPDSRAPGVLVIRGIPQHDCSLMGRVLHTCWHHDRYTLGGILVGLNPETMDAHWNLGATGEPYRNPRPQRRSARGRAVKPVKKMKVVTVSICEI